MADKNTKGPNPGNLELETVIPELRADIEIIKKNHSLYDEKNFSSRADVIDDLEFHIIERIDGLFQNPCHAVELADLKRDAGQVKLQLEKINIDLFQRIRAKIQMGGCRRAAFRDMIEEFVGDSLKESANQATIGYDNLDVFMDGLFPIATLPEETRAREPEMVFYQKTPARIIFELVDKANFSKGDVFYDLGSGLGQVGILVNLLSGVTTKGIEFEPAYCNYAKAYARQLNLPDVQFINADTREADYSDGTVFFMYTPFEGRMLDEVLEKLQIASKGREIWLFTYGPCSFQVGKQSWLKCENPEEITIYGLAMFSNKIIK